MRIVFLSDTHVSAAREESLEEIFEEEDYDFILSAGDWDAVPSFARGYPLYTIYGNHDEIPVLIKRTRLINNLKSPAGANVVDIGGLAVCALGGALIRDNYTYPKTWHTPEDYMKGYLVILDRIRNEFGKCDVLITHDSPSTIINFEKQDPNYRTNYVDSKSYRKLFDLIAEFLSPKIYLSGHVHTFSVSTTKYTPWDVYGATKAIVFLKNIFLVKNTYTVIDFSKNLIEVKNDVKKYRSKIAIGESKIVA